MLAVGALAHEMTFIEHLEELRRRILWSLAVIAVAFGVCWIFGLDRIGLLTARLLIHYLRHAALACIAVAAIITPTTDVANMLVIAGPMLLLYCAGIAVAWVFGRPGVHSEETNASSR
jgi:Sec-independent protein secretion pathway component TatC